MTQPTLPAAPRQAAAETADQGSILRPAVTLFVVLSVVTGLLYPLAVTGVAQTVFSHQANGSLITQNGKFVGSELIGQSFTALDHFWGRPSATATMPYNASASGGSNQGPTNPALVDAVKTRIEALRAADPGNTRAVPLAMVREIIPIQQDSIQEVSGRPTIVVRDEILPVRSLADLLGWQPTQEAQFGVLMHK